MHRARSQSIKRERRSLHYLEYPEKFFLRDLELLETVKRFTTVNLTLSRLWRRFSFSECRRVIRARHNGSIKTLNCIDNRRSLLTSIRELNELEIEGGKIIVINFNPEVYGEMVLAKPASVTMLSHCLLLALSARDSRP